MHCSRKIAPRANGVFIAGHVKERTEQGASAGHCAATLCAWFESGDFRAARAGVILRRRVGVARLSCHRARPLPCSVACAASSISFWISFRASRSALGRMPGENWSASRTHCAISVGCSNWQVYTGPASNQAAYPRVSFWRQISRLPIEHDQTNRYEN